MRTGSRPLLVASLVVSLSSCGRDEFLDCDDGVTDDFIAGAGSQAEQGLAVAGAWALPSSVRTQAEAYQFALQNAPPYNGGANCSGGATAGATALRTYLLQAFPQTSGIGIYNCRVIAGSTSMSLHGVGRALDVMIPTVGGDADNGKGDPIGAWLVTHAAEIGIQRVIWDHSIWGVDRTPHFRGYTGSNPHVDHLHVELNEAGAAKLTPWFQSTTTVPPPPACPALSASESIIDNGDDCLALLGPARFWRTETVGHGGDLAWTNAYSGTTPSNEARWTLRFTRPGRYRLAAWIDGVFGVFAHARYVVHASGAEHVIVVNQGTSAGWVELGTYAFAGSGVEDVRLADNAGTTVPAEQHIVVDALRITPEAAAPAPDAGTPPPADAGPAAPRDAGTAPPPDAGSTPAVDAGTGSAPAIDAGPAPAFDAGTEPKTESTPAPDPSTPGADEGTGEAAPVPGDEPAGEKDPDGEGCSAGGGSPAGFALALALAARRRSRRTR